MLAVHFTIANAKVNPKQRQVHFAAPRSARSPLFASCMSWAVQDSGRFELIEKLNVCNVHFRFFGCAWMLRSALVFWKVNASCLHQRFPVLSQNGQACLPRYRPPWQSKGHFGWLHERLYSNNWWADIWGNDKLKGHLPLTQLCVLFASNQRRDDEGRAETTWTVCMFFCEGKPSPQEIREAVFCYLRD